MKYVRNVLLFLTAATFVLVFSLFLFLNSKKGKGYIENHLSELAGLSIKYEKFKWGSKGATLLGVQIGQFVDLQKVALGYDWSLQKRTAKITSLNVHVKKIDVDQITESFTQNNETSRDEESSSLYQKFSKLCEALGERNVSLDVEKLVFEKYGVNTKGKFSFRGEKQKGQINLEGKVWKKSQKVNVELEGEFSCEEYTFLAQKVLVNGDGEVLVSGQGLRDVDLKIEDLKTQVKENGDVGFSFSSQASFSKSMNSKKLKIKVGSSRFEGLWSDKKKEKTYLRYSLRKLSANEVDGPEWGSVDRIKGKLSFREKGRMSLISHIRLKPDSQKEQTVSYKSIGKRSFVYLEKEKFQLDLEDLRDSVPLLAEKGILDLSGELSLGGKIEIQKGEVLPKVNLFGQKISLETETLKIKDALVQHQILNFSTFQGGEKSFFQTGNLKCGDLEFPVEVSFQAFDKDHFRVNYIKSEYDGSSVRVGSFLADLAKKSIGPAKVDINNLDIQKVFRAYVGSTIKATGRFSGELELQFKDGKPSVSGFLEAGGKGNLQYRPQGVQPPSPQVIGESPMEILQYYLYDFFYQTMNLKLVADRSFDLQMTLRAYGRNPSYLNGKPLKLNVDLRQNLLGVLRLMILMYRLPERLEEKLQKMGGE